MPNPFRINQAKQGYTKDQIILFEQRNFTKGINYALLPTAINFEGELIDAENLVVAIDGLLRTRSGTILVKDTGAEYPIRGMGEYKGALVYAQNGKLYVGSSEVGSLVNTTNNVEFINFHGYLIVCDGGVLKSWDGATFQDVPNAPKAKFGLSHKTRLWLGGDADNPYNVWISGPNDITDWGSNGEELGTHISIDPFEVSDELRNEVYGMGLFGDSVVAFKQGQLPRIFRIDGSGASISGLTSWISTSIMDGTSCINYRTVCFTPIGLLFLGQDGVYVIDGENQGISLQSYAINQQLMDDTYFDYTTASACYWAEKGLYLVASETTIWAFNVLTRGWFKWKMQESVSLTQNITSIKLINDVPYIGTEDGMIYKFGDYLDDAGEDIISKMYTGYYDFGNFSMAKIIKWLYLLMSVPSEGTITLTFVPDYAPLYGISLQVIYDASGNIHYQGSGVGGMVPPVERVIDIGTEYVGGWDDSSFGWDTTYTYGYDGRTVKPYMHKIALHHRCNTIGLVLEVDTPIVLQSLEFIAVPTRLSP